MGMLDGRIAVISGGARGQGASEARLFAEEGATVVVCDLLEAEGHALVDEINATRAGAAHFFRLDVAEESQWTALGAFLTTQFGQAHILVNNAGIIHRGGSLVTSLDDWERVMSVNLTGAFLGIKALTPLMQAAGSGSIINIGSIAGRAGYHSVSYGTSKWGLLGLTKSAAMELVDWNIRVNAVCPGIIETPLATIAAANYAFVQKITPQGRAGKADEIAQLVLFLASDKSGFITGEDIAIDGGMLAAGLFGHIGRETGVFPKRAEALIPGSAATLLCAT